jgi:hypothetical protein
LENNEQKIIKDIKKIGRLLKKKPGYPFSKREYLTYPGRRFSHNSIYDGGVNWQYYCEKAGFKPKCIRNRPDDFYFANLQRAIDDLGRFPKKFELKKYNLTHTGRRWAGQKAFFNDAIARKKVNAEGIPYPEAVPAVNQNSACTLSHDVKFFAVDIPPMPVPPVPLNSKRETWIRTNLSGFPYAPHDESGVIALFAVLCSKYLIPWQIVELNYGSGIDCICFHSSKKYEIRVEFKYIHNKSNWNHDISKLDYVVCWENKWPDFSKPVLELKSYIKGMRSC